MLSEAPRFDAAHVARLARAHFRIDAAPRELPSERDQNWLLETGGDALVLKIANAREAPDVLDAQQRALSHLSARLRVTPLVVRTLDGETTVPVEAEDGRRHLAWAITYLRGVPMGTLRRRSLALLEELGRTVGALSAALADFDHPAVHRHFYWDLAHGRDIVSEYRPLLADPAVGAAVDTLMARFEAHTSARLPALRRSVIHNDLNDYNVLVDRADRAPGDWRVSGVVDFGDMVHSYTVGDLAIAAAYALLDAPDPLAAVAAVVRGCHASFPLTEDELGALFGLVALRLCTSACVAAHQTRERPDNAYLSVSQAAVARALPRLARVPFALAEAHLRAACGLEPLPAGARVAAWLAGARDTLAPVLGLDPRREPCVVLDLSVGSPVVAGDPAENAEPMLTARVAQVMREAGARVGVGRYDEPRLLYTSPIFAPDDEGGERRTLHIGLDLFADAGTTVHAPLEGVVHTLAENPAPLDFGPLVILRHETGDGTPFFTLYGHLSRESLAALTVGARLAPGEQIGTLGAPAVNGGWTPHVHFQLAADLLDLGRDFPGVAPASQREAWLSLCPDPNIVVGVPSEAFPPRPPTRAEVLVARRRRIGPSLSIAYREPVEIVRGWRQHLFDETGRRYLDAYNNVPHVGHCHPRVAEAAQRQMRVLNTNTRYLHPLLQEYAARLTALLPAPLEVCYFVNSASEANELALRLARASTGRRDMIVLEGAYHGHTTGLVDVSPYKHAGPGGAGAPAWVHVAPLPDDYRGPYRRGEPDAGARYAAHVDAIVNRLTSAGGGPAGFLAETCPSVGGQLILPPGYLADVYRFVRAAGGVCVADEVQTGLGRMGTHCWAFEAQGVVPDVVVLGKPLGNGHPIGAVVTTREIADAFDNGMEFFSTFGGNTVSCAVGIAVLDVLRDEALQAHALRVGERLLAGLRPLIQRHALVGDVRGSGLFLGVELVRDRETLEPAGGESSYVANRMRDEGILLGTDGPYHNVVKIRPPMPFDDGDADRLVAVLDRVLAELR